MWRRSVLKKLTKFTNTKTYILGVFTLWSICADIPIFWRLLRNLLPVIRYFIHFRPCKTGDALNMVPLTLYQNNCNRQVFKNSARNGLMICLRGFMYMMDSCWQHSTDEQFGQLRVVPVPTVQCSKSKLKQSGPIVGVPLFIRRREMDHKADATTSHKCPVDIRFRGAARILFYSRRGVKFFPLDK